jgi:hypothetical protein
MNSHMTHTLTRSARRPLSDGYQPSAKAVRVSMGPMSSKWRGTGFGAVGWNYCYIHEPTEAAGVGHGKRVVEFNHGSNSSLSEGASNPSDPIM